MTIEMIETFLAVMECRNVTAAAQRLYVTQSTASHRLALLEQEVGSPLFLRRRGQRMVEPTEAGEEFAAIAERWMALMRDTSAIALRGTRRPFAFGATNLVNTFTFVPLYQELVGSEQDVRISVRTFHSAELYQQVESRAVDMGFVYGALSVPEVLTTPLYQEPMRVVLSGGTDVPETVDPRDLPAEREVYLRWNTPYELWHNRFWPQGSCLCQVDTGNQLPLALALPGGWAIAPASIARSIEGTGGLVSRRLGEEAPPLHCFEIHHRYPRPSAEDLIERFSERVHEYVCGREDLLPSAT